MITYSPDFITNVTYSPEFLDASLELFQNLFIICIISFFSLIFTISAMFVIYHNSQKLNVKCWHWNLAIFFLSSWFLAFIPIIFYINFVRNKNPIIQNNTIISTQPNENNQQNNIPNTNYSSSDNSFNKKNKLYSKYLIFYAILQFIFLCVFFGLLINMIQNFFDMIKYSSLTI